MITNYFFLSAGLIAVLFSVGHGVFVQKHIMGEVNATGMQKSAKRAIFAFLHYPTSMLFLSAIALIIISTVSDVSAVHLLAWFIAAINASNLIVAMGATLAKDREALPSMALPSMAMIVWLGIIVAGIYG